LRTWLTVSPRNFRAATIALKVQATARSPAWLNSAARLIKYC
jgi:hypothetical protein